MNFNSMPRITAPQDPVPSTPLPQPASSSSKVRMSVRLKPIDQALQQSAEQERLAATPILDIHNLSLFYGATQALHGISLQVPRHCVTAFIGPSGCGKSSLLRCINRMNDFIPRMRIDGRILFQNQDIYAPQVNPIRLRRYIGMVFQRSNPFPKSIFENVAFGLRLHKMGNPQQIREQVEEALHKVALWDEVKDRLNTNAMNLSGGQQQRVCLARAIAIKPHVLLMDEPASALDPIATAKIEELILQLKQDYTIVIVTHNLQQAGRCSDYTAFFYLGHLIEFDSTENMFSSPREEATEAYINGRFG